MNKKKVIAISGSTRQHSINHALIKAIADLTTERLDITIDNSIGGLPQFNPDDDVANVANEVADFRQQLNAADGIIICTPEYARGVPGSLKNAIDWTVSSSEFYQKPVMLITASTDGTYGHGALLETLKAVEAKGIGALQMIIQFAKTKISVDGRITDEETLTDVNRLVIKFIETMNDN